MERKELKELIEKGILQETPDVQLVKEELDELVSKGFIRSLSDQYFEFDNNLTWEVVYETLLYAERRRIHGLVASHIELGNSHKIESVADVLAHHYGMAGNIKKQIWFTSIAAKRAADMYSNDDALTYFNSATDLIKDMGKDESGDSSVINEKIGDIYEQLGKHRDAIASYTESLLLWSKLTEAKRRLKLLPWKIKYASRESHLCQKIAVSYEHDGKYDNSIKWLDKADNALPKHPGPIQAQISAARCAVLYRMGEYQSAILAGKQAVVSAKKAKDLNSTAYAFRSLANNYLYCGNVIEATSYNKKSVDIYNDLQDYAGGAVASNNLANCYVQQAKIKSAIDSYIVALKAYEKLQNEFGISMCNLNLGAAYLEKGELPEAETYLQKIIRAFKAGKCPPDMAGAAWGMKSQCEILKTDYVKAGEFIQKGISLINETGQAGLLLNSKLVEAEVMIEAGDYQQGSNIVKDVQNEILDKGAVHIDALASRLLGIANAKMGLYDDAISYFEKSIKLYNETDAILPEAVSIFYQVNTLAESGVKYPEAANILERAIDIFKLAENQYYLNRSTELQKKLH